MSRPIFPEFERALVARAGLTLPSRSSTRFGRAGRSVARGLVPAATVAVSLAVLVVGVVALRGGHVRRERPAAQPTAAVPAAVRPLLAKYAIFQRAQTPADLAIAGTLHPGGGTIDVSNLVVRGERRQTYVVSGIAHYVVIPALTRGVKIGGIRVGLFVEQFVRPRAAVRVTTAAGRPVSNAIRTAVVAVVKADFIFAFAAGGEAPDRLTVRAGAPSGNVLSLTLGPINHAAAELYRFLMTTIHGIGGTIVAVVPDGIRTVRWVWARRYDHAHHRYLPRISASAIVDDNVAVARAPARFAGPEGYPEAVILWNPSRRTTVRYLAGRGLPRSVNRVTKAIDDGRSSGLSRPAGRSR